MNNNLKNKSVIFELHHPKHYHIFKKFMPLFDNYIVVIKSKDVLENLLKEDGVPYILLSSSKKGIRKKLMHTFSVLSDYYKIIKEFKPDFIISKGSPYAEVLKPMFSYKTIVFPDAEVVWLNNNFLSKAANLIITPSNFRLDYGKNHHKISTFLEMIYLHKNQFQPEKDNLKIEKVDVNRPYAVLRFISWDAFHDVKESGLSTNDKLSLINLLLSLGLDVYISSESELPEELQKYKLKINPSQIHNLLYFAQIYIGDSQSMATESALLGTPSYRINSFVGENDMSNFIILEKELELLKNFKTFKEAQDSIEKHNLQNEKEIHREKLDKYLFNIEDPVIQVQNIIHEKFNKN